MVCASASWQSGRFWRDDRLRRGSRHDPRCLHLYDYSNRPEDECSCQHNGRCDCALDEDAGIRLRHDRVLGAPFRSSDCATFEEV